MDLTQAFRYIVDNLGYPVFIFDTGMNIIYINPAAETLTGWKRDELQGKKGSGFLSEIMPCFDWVAMFQEVFENSRHERYNENLQLYKKDGTCRNVRLEAIPVCSPSCIEGIMIIIGELTDANPGVGSAFSEDEEPPAVWGNDVRNNYRRERLKHLRYLSFHDSLTGLYNRAYFEEELVRLDAGRQLPFSLVIGDMNCLKLVNDVFGHIEGDRLLVSISRILRKCCRKDDIIVRWGGDEFAIILPGSDSKVASRICRRIKKACDETDVHSIALSIALGHATKNDPGQNAFQLLKEAEDKMYHDKLADNHRIRNMAVESLMNTLIKRGVETEHHIKYMKTICEKIGKAIGLGETELEQLLLLAELHDIGNIAIPEEVLFKTDALSDAEREIVKKHAEIGYRIAEYTPRLCPIAYAVLSHHERYDGTGYPQGLKGDEIPLISRIMAIADAYCALICKKPYRQPMEPDKALAEIGRNAGSQFDPHLVKVFMDIADKPEICISWR